MGSAISWHQMARGKRSEGLIGGAGLRVECVGGAKGIFEALLVKNNFFTAMNDILMLNVT